MSRYWAEVNRGKTSESRAWCEVGCSFEAVDGAHGSYRASQAARRHTEKTGHTTTFDRSYSVFIKGVPRRVPESTAATCKRFRHDEHCDHD